MSSNSCRWCKRSRTEPNPVASRRQSHPTLEWKREQGRECKTCPNVIAKWYWQTSKDQLEERLGKSPEEQLKFANRVQTWEAEKNLGKRSWNHEKFEKRRPQGTSVFVDRADEVRTEDTWVTCGRSQCTNERRAISHRANN